LAEKNITAIIPGYTHLQIAQPVLLAHHLLAYLEMFIRDTQRLQELLKRIDVMPLGSAAMAGSTYALDRRELAKDLGFKAISENSMDAVSDRDFIIEFQAAAALIMLHLSRMAEELIIWNSEEFKFVELDDKYATGSSIMPQKKNPDIPELIRGKTGSVIGALVAILTTVKALPLSYNRDLQEDKELLFKTVMNVNNSLVVMKGLLATLKFNKERMYAVAENSFCNATDLADYLVGKGVAFRNAHEIVGKLVKYCIDSGRKLKDVSLETYKRFHGYIQKDVYAYITLEASVAARDIYGGTAPKQVRKAIQRAKKRI
jgi:argininosuccinate lyase